MAESLDWIGSCQSTLPSTIIAHLNDAHANPSSDERDVAGPGRDGDEQSADSRAERRHADEFLPTVHLRPATAGYLQDQVAPVEGGDD